MDFQNGYTEAYKDLIKHIMERAGFKYEENSGFVPLGSDDEAVLEALRIYNII